MRVGDRWEWDMTVFWLWGYIDREGKTVIPARFYEAEPFSEGLAAVQSVDEDGGPGPWGFIDHRGEWVIAPQFKYRPSGFADGVARVSDRGRGHFITKHGTARGYVQPSR